jgi:hypothetical protein
MKSKIYRALYEIAIEAFPIRPDAQPLVIVTESLYDYVPTSLQRPTGREPVTHREDFEDGTACRYTARRIS